jgi:hypothetical protein
MVIGVIGVVWKVLGLDVCCRKGVVFTVRDALLDV